MERRQLASTPQLQSFPLRRLRVIRECRDCDRLSSLVKVPLASSTITESTVETAGLSEAKSRALSARTLRRCLQGRATRLTLSPILSVGTTEKA